MKMKLRLLFFVMVCTVSGYSQDKDLKLISPSSEDAGMSYYHQSPESPDGKKIAFKIFNTPDTMEIVVKDLENEEYFTIAKVNGQFRNTDAYPIWVNNETLLYNSFESNTIYRHNIFTGQKEEFEGGEICDYSVTNNKILYRNKKKSRGEVGIYILDLNANETKCIIKMEDVAPLKDKMGTVNPVKEWRLDNPCWSPDGKKILFQVRTKEGFSKGNDYILFADEDGKNIYPAGFKPINVQWWDNESVYGVNWDKKANREVRRLNLTGKVIEVASGHGNHAAVSPNTDWIVTDTRDGSDPIKVLLYKRGETVPTKELFVQPTVVGDKNFWETGPFCNPAFSRDGKKVYFNGQAKDGKWKLWCYDLSNIISKSEKKSKK